MRPPVEGTAAGRAHSDQDPGELEHSGGGHVFRVHAKFMMRNSKQQRAPIGQKL